MHPFIKSSTQPNRPQHIHNYTPTSYIHDYPTRFSHNDRLYIPNTNTHSNTQTTDFLTEQYMQTWNTLPISLRNIAAPGLFKKKLKLHLLEQQKGQC